MKQWMMTVLMSLTFFCANAQDKQASGLRADGKIYVVVAVVVTILAGLFLYLLRLDKKITRLEKGATD